MTILLGIGIILAFGLLLAVFAIIVENFADVLSLIVGACVFLFVSGCVGECAMEVYKEQSKDKIVKEQPKGDFDDSAFGH